MLSLESLQGHLKGALETETSHQDCARQRFLFSPGPFPPQDVNLIGHNAQSHRREDDEEDQESDQRFVIV